MSAFTSALAQTITTIAGIERIRPMAAVQLVGGRCQPEGQASTPSLLDPKTNLLKNRIDSGNYRRTTIATLLKLPWASAGDSTKHMATRRRNWSSKELARSARYESRPVTVDGFIVSIHTEGPEGANCGLTDPEWPDWHFWIVSTEVEAHNSDVTRRKVKALVGEITPRVRAANPGAFDRKQLMKWAHDGVRVRVSGWTMLDPDHPDDAGPGGNGQPASRGTIWEIHPVMSVVALRK